MDTPEFFDRVECDDLLKQVVPVVTLAAGGLGEPQRPLVLEGVLDVEVVLVMEDGDGLAAVGGGSGSGVLLSVGGDGDGREIDLLIHVGGCLSSRSGMRWTQSELSEAGLLAGQVVGHR